MCHFKQRGEAEGDIFLCLLLRSLVCRQKGLLAPAGTGVSLALSLVFHHSSSGP